MPAGRALALRGFIALTLAYVVGVVILLGLIALGGGRQGWPALFREALHLVLAPAPFLLVAAVVLRARCTAIALVVPTLAVMLLVGPRSLPGYPPAPAGPALRIYSLNIGASRGLGRAEAIVPAIRAADADVVALVEARADTLSTVGRAIGDLFPYQAGSRSVFVFSRLPVIDAGAVAISDGAHDALTTTLSLDGRCVTLIAAHLRRTDDYPGLRRGLGPLLRAGDGFSTGRRDAAAGDLLRLIRTVDGARILVGDFNMTPTSHTYRMVSAELRDSFRDAGWGPGHTYPRTLGSVSLDLSLPLLRIDYIFHSPELAAARAWVGPNAGSDHLPVLAELMVADRYDAGLPPPAAPTGSRITAGEAACSRNSPG